MKNNSNEKCFVLMPFKDKFNNPWEFAIQPAANDNGLKAFRADDTRLVGGKIASDITKSIIDADLIIAEMTDQNPNVLYELGLAHAAKKRVIMISQEMSHIPFDIKDIRCIHYDINQLLKLKSELSVAIKSILKNIDTEKHDFFPELKVITPEKQIQIQRLEQENNELKSLAHGINVTITPKFAYIFFNNRYVGISPQIIHVNPYHHRNVVTVYAIRHFEEYRIITSEDIESNRIHINLKKRKKELFPERVHHWLKYIRLNPDDVVIGRAITTYLVQINECEEAINQHQGLLKICNNWSMIYNGIGYSLSILGRYDEALKYYIQVEKMEDTYIGPYNLACVYSKLKQYEKCLTKLQKIVHSDQLLKQMVEIDPALGRLDNDSAFDNIRNDKVYKDNFSEINKLYKTKRQEICNI